MRISRLYVDQPLQAGQNILLDEEVAHYVRTVLRLKAQQPIVLFNGAGGEFRCLLTGIDRKTVRVRIETYIDRDVESPLTIKLGVGISRGDRMDWAVQKAVELGVNHLTPLITERCVIKFNDDKKQLRLQHWRNIILHACEQSGRTRLPELGEISDLDEWATLQTDLKAFLDPFAEQTLDDFPPQTSRITLLSGPEGGFSEQERQSVKMAGFIPVRLGGRILRTETAVISALAAVQTLWGDFK
ncbi:MAG: 16S rRNA (uracil(1498)-N(3))-methyltransferase [Methylomonas sp.]|jgi:16S rRNA (uracil1498-N3)-methyltransferase